MGMPFKAAVPAVVLTLLALALPAQASAVRANVAALQVALRAVHLYGGSVDGIAGPATRGAVRRFQRRKRLAVDGFAGPQTRRALGRRGRPSWGSRVMKSGHRGWDVSALQFLLARRGFSTGGVDGGFGPNTASAVRRFQSSRGLTADGLVGPATRRALRRRGSGMRRVSGPVSGPVSFLRPVRAPMGDRFGLRWGRMHTGIDFPAPVGATVGAAGRGTVKFAGWNSGGYGYLVVISHRLGFETWYAHLSRIYVSSGQAVAGGSRIAGVGSTGHSTGPHLHFEVRLNGTPIDPSPRLLTAYSVRRVATRLECFADGAAESTGNDPATAVLATRCDD
jgi:murein DD-endopeptidase MepM/ murein hydrolase activator NlpD